MAGKCLWLWIWEHSFGAAGLIGSTETRISWIASLNLLSSSYTRMNPSCLKTSRVVAPEMNGWT